MSKARKEKVRRGLGVGLLLIALALWMNWISLVPGSESMLPPCCVTTVTHPPTSTACITTVTTKFAGSPPLPLACYVFVFSEFTIVGTFTVLNGVYYLTNPGGGISANNSYYLLEFSVSPPALASGTQIIVSGPTTQFGNPICNSLGCEDGIISVSSIQIGSSWLIQTVTQGVTTWVQGKCTVMTSNYNGWTTTSCAYSTPVPLSQIPTHAGSMPQIAAQQWVAIIVFGVGLYLVFKKQASEGRGTTVTLAGDS